MNFKSYLKELKSNYRHWILIAFIILSILLLIFYFKYAFLRIAESFVDLKNSFLFYLNELFGANFTGSDSVIEFSNTPFEMPFDLPNSWEEFKIAWTRYFQSLVSWNNIQLYFKKVIDIIYYISKFLIIIFPFILIFVIVSKIKGEKTNND